RLPVHSDQFIEPIGVAAFLRDEKNRRPLMCGKTLAVDEKLISLRLTAEDRMVVEHETAAALVLLKEHRGRQSADATADGDEIVHLAGFYSPGDRVFEAAIAHRMRGGHYIPCVAVRAAIVADAAVSVEGVS